MNFFAWLTNLFTRPQLPTPAPPARTRKLTAPGFNFVVEVDGEDLVVRDTRCTCFGGDSDPQDSGETASGVLTKGRPTLLGCALPMDYRGPDVPTRAALLGSPLPMMPWRMPVEVTCSGKTIVIPSLDFGPNKRTGNGLDLTIGAARQFDPQATATRFEAVVTYRVRGGAKYLPAA